MANMLFLGNTPLIDLSGYYTKGEVDAAISNIDVTDQLTNYVEKVEGKGLSTNDFTNTYKNSLDNLPNNYVAKDGNKVLSSNDFTDALKTKLEGLENFDPTNINSAISAIEGTLGDITGDGKEVTAALDTWAEIKAFISDYQNTDSVASLLSTLESNIHSWVEGKNYTTVTELGLDDYAKTADVASTYETKEDAKNHINGAGVTNVVAITASDFANLETKDATTLYIVK